MRRRPGILVAVLDGISVRLRKWCNLINLSCLLFVTHGLPDLGRSAVEFVVLYLFHNLGWINYTGKARFVWNSLEHYVIEHSRIRYFRAKCRGLAGDLCHVCTKLTAVGIRRQHLVKTGWHAFSLSWHNGEVGKTLGDFQKACRYFNVSFPSKYVTLSQNKCAAEQWHVSLF
jgi:hypothetical protein